MREGSIAVAAFCMWLLFILGLVFFKFWLIGSVVTSGVKAVSGDCGASYGIPVVAQDWFCSDEK